MVVGDVFTRRTAVSQNPFIFRGLFIYDMFDQLYSLRTSILSHELEMSVPTDCLCGFSSARFAAIINNGKTKPAST